MSTSWVIAIIIAEAVLGEAVCYWRRASQRARDTIAADARAIQAARARLALAKREQVTLTGLARRRYPAWIFRDGRTLADNLRQAFPDVPDTQLARAALHARWVVTTQYAGGRNCAQISQVFAAAALDLAAIDVSMHGRVSK